MPRLISTTARDWSATSRRQRAETYNGGESTGVREVLRVRVVGCKRHMTYLEIGSNRSNPRPIGRYPHSGPYSSGSLELVRNPDLRQLPLKRPCYSPPEGVSGGLASHAQLSDKSAVPRQQSVPDLQLSAGVTG